MLESLLSEEEAQHAHCSLPVTLDSFSVIAPLGQQQSTVVQTDLSLPPCLATASGWALTLRCLRFLLFEACLHRATRSVRSR